jgi:hypothetical protein
VESPKSRLAPFLGASALALVLISGCGGGGSTTVINRTVTVTDGSTETTPTTTTTETGTTESTPTQTLHLSTFRSPSGNIGCVLLDGTARCDIAKRAWSPPKRPPGCPDEVDFGQGLQVGRNDQSGSFVCAGDTALNPEAAALAYGSDDRSGGFLCTSRAAGVTCTNSGGHGFFISIQSYRTF